MSMTDEQIIQMVGCPDTKEQGFAYLMQAYQRRLYVHVRHIVGTHEDTDDVLQNVFIKGWTHIESFRGESSLYSWLYRIASNESFTHLRKHKKHASVSDAAAVVVEKGAGQAIEGAAVEALLQQALLLLPERQREVFCLRYFDEMPYEEMSTLLATSVGALKASYHHAAKKIESFLLKQH